jgi:major membrane immunogen (membrane-anchored lipoprotein)
MRKSTVVILNQLNIKNNKIDKYNFKKIITKKIMWGNTVAIHSVLKKKTTKLNSQSAQYEKKKKSTKTILEKKNKKKS